MTVIDPVLHALASIVPFFRGELQFVNSGRFNAYDVLSPESL